MTEVPLSIVAWISVVLIQAVIHYFVLGTRRKNRMVSDAEDMLLEESLSLTDGTEYTSDDSISYQGSLFSGNDNTDSRESMVGEKVFVDDHGPQEFLDLLSQTGSEILKVRKKKEQYHGHFSSLRGKLIRSVCHRIVPFNVW